MEAIQSGFNQVLEQLAIWGPRVLLGLLLVGVGWIVAKVIQKAVTALAHKIGLDKPFEQVNADVEAPDLDEGKRPSRLFGIGAFWLIMLFVLVGFFSAMNLSSVASPLNSVLERIGEGLPNLIAAIALLVLGWLIATVAKSGIVRGMKSLDIDAKIGKLGVLNEEQVEKKRVTMTIGILAYGLIILLFAQSALELIGLSLVATSLQRMMNSAVDIVPAFLNAAVIAALALLLASFLRPVVTSLLAATGVDKLGRHVGLPEKEGDRLTVSTIVGHLVYWLILLFAFPAVLDRLGLGTMAEPLQDAWSVVIASLPNVGAAFLIVLAAFLLCKLVGPIVQRILESVGFDDVLERLGLVKLHQAVKDGNDTARPSRIATNVVLLIIVLVLAQQALAALGMGYLAELAAQIVMFLPNILVAVAIFGFALFLGRYVGGLVTSAMTGVDKFNGKLVAGSANVAIVVFGTAMALSQLNIAPGLVENAVLLLIGAVCLAAAISFGLGSKPVVERYMERKYSDWNS